MSAIARFLLPIVLIASSGLAHAQAFDVASVRPSQQSVKFERDGETRVQNGELHMRDVTISTCIKWAYSVQQAQIIAPHGMDEQHYDIIAKAPAGTSAEKMRPMLATLLTERFHLQFHHDKKELHVYSMTVAKSGLKIHPAAHPEADVFRENSATGMIARNISMKQLADYVSGPLGAPLVDDTGLTGGYDLTIDFTPYVDQQQENQPGPASVLNAAFKGDLGLQMAPSKVVVDVLVIDHVEAASAN